MNHSLSLTNNHLKQYISTSYLSLEFNHHSSKYISSYLLYTLSLLSYQPLTSIMAKSIRSKSKRKNRTEFRNTIGSVSKLEWCQNKCTILNNITDISCQSMLFFLLQKHTHCTHNILTNLDTSKSFDMYMYRLPQKQIWI